MIKSKRIIQNKMKIMQDSPIRDQKLLTFWCHFFYSNSVFLCVCEVWLCSIFPPTFISTLVTEFPYFSQPPYYGPEDRIWHSPYSPMGSCDSALPTEAEAHTLLLGHVLKGEGKTSPILVHFPLSRSQ